MSAAFHHVKWDGYSPFRIGFDIDAPDAYTDWIRNHNRPEPSLQYVLQALSGNKKLIDLGANIGYYTLAAASSGARVLAVEALPKNYSLLVASAATNHFTTVIPVHAAIYDNTGVLSMGGSSAWGQVLIGGTGQQVPAITLDDLTQIYGFSDADVLKMDVEGAELAALKGGTRFLSGAANLRVIFEANAYAGLNFRYRIDALLREFESLGFALFMIVDNTLVPRRSFDFQECIYSDYLAVKNTALAALPGFEVRALTVSEQANIIEREASIMPPPHQAYIHVCASLIPAEVKRTSVVQTALSALSLETSPEFQSASAALKTLYL